MAKNPDNKVYFAVARKVANALKKEGIKYDGDLAQPIFNVLRGELEGRLIGENTQSADMVSADIKKWIDNPMSAEEEAKTLRAILHSELSKGTISPQILDKLDKIIGVSTGEDDKIELVEFKDAFTDLAESVEICRKILEEQAHDKAGSV